MLSLIFLVISSIVIISLFCYMIFLKVNIDKKVGPNYWEYGYDRARLEREMKEELSKKSKEKTHVDIKGLDEYLS